MFFKSDDYFVNDVKGVNLCDFGKVYNAFGKRPYLNIVGVATY
ncbi:hypothetical protein PL371_05610 [Tenacibaculum maritimum]|nr:hypothetical protein [Tenacibaculum maritimum]MDB0611354.1 hypothetical protein [Tenacibaculum maritimum]